MTFSRRFIITAMVVLVGATTAFSGFGLKASEDEVYTLYRNSVTRENMRIHVATFDASDGEDYNNGNCNIAQELFQHQSGVKVKYWCEKGYFKK